MSSKNVVDLRKKRPGRHLFDQAPLPLAPQKRISPIRARRRRIRMIVASVVASVLVACAFYLAQVSYLPRYSVGTVEVTGAQTVSPELVADYAQSIIYDGSHHFFSRANLLLYPKALIEKDIPLEFPRIASASVSSGLLSNAIIIKVTERTPFALWCLPAQAGTTDGTCYDMDENGFLFAQAPATASTSGEYIFTGGVSVPTTSQSVIGQTFVSGHSAGLVAFLQLLSQSGLTPLGASVQSDQDFTVPLRQGFSLYASFGEDPAALANNVELILSSNALSGQEQNLAYIDLRFGDKVYYKLKGEGQASSTQQ
ncbi:MAG TPA: hypothetical protein VG102_01850 [Candidatus Paceibacterota bacterium]|nr:hypothetical protein [Candidatus Paceibacterota bacterium]